MAVEKLLGIEVPQRAATIRVLVMEINRIASHLVGLATGGMELGALTAMTNGFREREMCLDLLEEITGLRMNHAYIRPGGLAQDLPEGAVEHDPRVPEDHAEAGGRLPPDAHRPADLAAPAQGRRLPRRHRLPRARRHRPDPAGRRPARGTCARSSPTSATRPTTSRCRPPTPPTPGAATWSAWPRSTSRSSSSRRRWTGSSPARSWSRTARSPGPRSSRSAPTAWATPSTTCGTSWASRWRP